MQNVLFIALAGAAGALSRHGLNLAVGSLTTLIGMRGDFPWGIFVVNIVGCFIFGVIWEMAAARQLISDTLRTVLLVGFVGSFTTFSTLISDTNRLLDNSQEWWMLLNLGGQVVLGVVALRLGFWCVRAL